MSLRRRAIAGRAARAETKAEDGGPPPAASSGAAALDGRARAATLSSTSRPRLSAPAVSTLPNDDTTATPAGFVRGRAASVDLGPRRARASMQSSSVGMAVAPLPEGDEAMLVRLLEPAHMTLAADGAELLHTLKLTQAVNCVAFSGGGSLLASGGVDALVRIWDAKDGSIQRVLRGHTDRVWSVEFSPGEQAGAGCRRRVASMTREQGTERRSANEICVEMYKPW